MQLWSLSVGLRGWVGGSLHVCGEADAYCWGWASVARLSDEARSSFALACYCVLRVGNLMQHASW